MKVKLNGKNVEITKGMQYYADKKFKYFDKFMPTDTPVNVSVSKRGNQIKLESYFIYCKKDVKAKVQEADYNTAIDKLMDVLKNSVSSLHRQITNKSHVSLKSQHKKLQDEELKETDEENENEILE